METRNLARILVVEDEGIVALSLKDKLEGLGYDVVDIVSTGEDAVERTGQFSPDMVLMDIKLRGEMDGVTAANEIRKMFSTPVIYLTAFGNQDTMERAKVTEPYGYILKPFHERELHIAIEIAMYRHRAESALRESEEKYRLLFDKGPVPLFVLDSETRGILASNETAQLHYGYSEEQILTLSLDDICLSCGDTDDPYHGRWMHSKKNGEEMHVEVSAHEISFLGNNAVLLHVRDVTQRVHAEQMLEQRQKALQGVYRIATAPGGTFTRNCEHVAVTLSNLLGVLHVFVLKVTGHDAYVLAGSSGSDLQDMDIQFSCKDLFGGKYSEGSRVSDVDGPFFETPDAIFKERFAHGIVMTVPVVEVNSSLVGAIMVVGDHGREFGIEDVLVAEIFARYIAHEIEREKLSASLAEAQKMEVIGKLSGGVAHEVRNPLNAILAISDALAKDIGEHPEYKEFLYHMRLQVDRLSALMNDMLDLGKPVERMYFRNESVVSLCDSVIDLWRHSLLHHEAVIDLSLSDEAMGMLLYCDPERMQQVFLNLLENAVQHSPKGATVCFEVSLTEDRWVMFQVVDAGIGIVDEVDRIFEPFFSTRRGGTGLGLSIVKHFVEQHKGTVSAWNNSPGQGLTVQVQLPVSEISEEKC